MLSSATQSATVQLCATENVSSSMTGGVMEMVPLHGELHKHAETATSVGGSSRLQSSVESIDDPQLDHEADFDLAV